MRALRNQVLRDLDPRVSNSLHCYVSAPKNLELDTMVYLGLTGFI